MLPNSREILAKIDLSHPFIPGEQEIFRALRIPPESIKVCIVGQDPYPSPEHAMGLAFSVPREIEKLPPTLKNILQELKDDVGISAPSGDLSSWEEAGVLLLNRTLTTVPHQSLAHHKIGWEKFTEELASYLSEQSVVFLLWGKSAQQLLPSIDSSRVVLGVHPSPLSAYRGFFGSKPFTAVNRKLGELGISEIDWKIE